MKNILFRKFKTDFKFLVLFSILALIIFIIFNGSDTDNIKLSADNKSIQKLINNKIDLFDKDNINKINEFRIEIDKEYLLSLEASVPQNQKCLKVRYKYAPLKSFKVDQVSAKGKAFIKLRGYCDTHWYSQQKSLKIKLKMNDLFGYKTFNLNAMTTDPMFFDKFYGDLLENNGGISSKIKFVKLYINGKYNGLRQLVQNLDDNLIKNEGFELGSIYRERAHANFGEDLPLWKLKTLWQRNSKNYAPKWHDFRELQRKIKKSVLYETQEFKSVLDSDMYLKYLSILAISGTQNMGTHNIPIYRPASSKKFKPIGYDFSVQKDPVPLEGMKIHDMQNNYLNWHWLSGLYWQDISFRENFYKATADILKSNNFIEKYNEILTAIQPIIKKEVNVNYKYRDYKSFEELKENGIKRLSIRINYLNKMFLTPEVLIHPNWISSNDFQFVVNGLGIYSFKLKIKKTKCSKKILKSIKLKIQTGKNIELLTCNNGYYSSKTVILERNDISKPDLNNNKTIRNSLGAILVNLKNTSNIKIEKILVESKQTNKILPIYEIWPFHIKKKSEQLVSLGKNLSSNMNDFSGIKKSSYQIFNVNKRKLYNLKTVIENKITFFSINKTTLSSVWSPEEFGPILCWSLLNQSHSLKKSDGCFEFHLEWFDQKDIKKVMEVDMKHTFDKVITNKDIMNCKKFRFEPGKNLILESLIFPKKCKLIFLENANLYFNPGVFMVINNEYLFPSNNKKVYFRKAENKAWGGIIIKYKGKNLIQNAFFSGAGEFYYKKKRYTGALNLDKVPKSKVTKSIFISNTGDDALNVIGGDSEVIFNYFSKNRDAIDMDLGKGKITYNIFSNNQDDAIDLGSVKSVDITNNLIKESGDKGISVGEGSVTFINSNMLVSNIIGVAIKDGSIAKINKNQFINNFIATSVYTKFTLKNNIKNNIKNIASGTNFYKGNEYKAKKNKIAIDISYLNLNETLSRKNIEKNIIFEFNRECIKCLNQ